MAYFNIYASRLEAVIRRMIIMYRFNGARCRAKDPIALRQEAAHGQIRTVIRRYKWAAKIGKALMLLYIIWLISYKFS